jgi:flavin-dependent dehydrogenase
MVQVSDVKGSVDIFVIGGGPAGLAAAIAARQKGLHVIVADGSEPPIDKPCGEGLMPETQVALRDLGISADDLGGYALRGIRFVQRREQVAAAFPKGRGIGIRRTVLHELLVTRARDCGVQFLWNTPVSGIWPGGVQTSRGSINAKWIVGADGSGSRVRRWCGLDANRARSLRHATRRHYLLPPWTEFVEIYWGRRCQAYVTPVSRQEICVVVLAADAHDANFDVALRNWPQLHERLTESALASRERGAVTFMHRLRHVVTGNVALLGDSSGGVDAITGEGLRLCFLQALALADAMAGGDLRLYERAHKKLAVRAACMGQLILLLAGNDMLRERAIRCMAAKPEVFGKLLAIHAGHSTPAEVVSAGLHLGWRFLAT